MPSSATTAVVRHTGLTTSSAERYCAVHGLLRPHPSASIKARTWPLPCTRERVLLLRGGGVRLVRSVAAEFTELQDPRFREEQSAYGLHSRLVCGGGGWERMGVGGGNAGGWGGREREEGKGKEKIRATSATDSYDTWFY